MQNLKKFDRLFLTHSFINSNSSHSKKNTKMQSLPKNTSLIYPCNKLLTNIPHQSVVELQHHQGNHRYFVDSTQAMKLMNFHSLDLHSDFQFH